jgi:hypothetical protein
MYKTRNDFGKLFQEHFKTGKGAEIGVQNGFNSQQIFKHWQGLIFLVDKWDNPNELKHCVALLKDNLYHILIGDSVKESESLPGRSLDWVYIDAGHSYAEVKADFEAWFPKVRKGGIVSGHDYGDNDCIGVKEFIDEYMQLHPEVKMHFTSDDFWEGKEYQSWWFIKK